MTYLIDTNTFRKFGLGVLAAALLACHGAQAEAPTNPVLAFAVAPVAVAPAPIVSRKSAAPAVAHARLARQSGIGLVLGVGF
jgi:hypothetical protein